jgi:hypothetical protein
MVDLLKGRSDMTVAFEKCCCLKSYNELGQYREGSAAVLGKFSISVRPDSDGPIKFQVMHERDVARETQTREGGP